MATRRTWFARVPHRSGAPRILPPMDLSTLLAAATAAVAGYLIGGIPWGVIIARVVGGPDPRTLGSGRTGGANVLRALGPRAAAVSGLLDMLKGTAAVALVRLLGLGPAFEVIAALAAILGHSRSPFIGFQGGRGVSAAYGGLLIISPLAAAVVLPLFAVVVLVSRYSSLGSLTGAVAGGVVLAAQVLAAGQPAPYLFYALAGPAMIWLFHADNIQRLLNGTERKVGQR